MIILSVERLRLKLIDYVEVATNLVIFIDIERKAYVSVENSG